MNVLIVYAHPEPRSFNGATKGIAVETLQNAGYEVVASNLYAMGFEAVVGPVDFCGATRPIVTTCRNIAPPSARERFLN